VPKAAADPWHRTAGCNCDRGLHRQRRSVRKGREFAAWLGLLPNQRSTGGKAKLGAISRRGNCYLRKILIHGARAVVLRSKRDRIAMGAWMTSLETRAPRNILVVATAHKLARIAWAVLSTGQDYRAAVPAAVEPKQIH
jgi:transposase